VGEFDFDGVRTKKRLKNEVLSFFGACVGVQSVPEGLKKSLMLIICCWVVARGKVS
jgi:hypothetical protein